MSLGGTDGEARHYPNLPLFSGPFHGLPASLPRPAGALRRGVGEPHIRRKLADQQALREYRVCGQLVTQSSTFHTSRAALWVPAPGAGAEGQSGSYAGYEDLANGPLRSAQTYGGPGIWNDSRLGPLVALTGAQQGRIMLPGSR